MNYTKRLGEWFRREYEEEFARVNRFNLFLGCAVWGEKYVRRFLQYGVPSLLAPGNLPVLAGLGDNVKLMIHTDEASFPLFRDDPGINQLHRLGVEIEVVEIPKDIIERTPEKNEYKYRLIGALHNLHMKQAKFMRYGYHMLMPDHVYSENYFSGLRKKAKGHDAVVHGGLSCYVEDIPLYPKDGVLAVDSKTLNGIGWSRIHKSHQPHIMNGRDMETDCPVASYMAFSSEKYVHILCPHHSIAYLSPAALMRGPVRLFNTIDSQLPYFISESMSCCVPSPEDDMSYIEVSDADKLTFPMEPHDLLMFCLQFWLSAYCEEGYLRFFDMDNILELPERYQHPVHPVTESEISLAKDKVRKAVRENREICMKSMKPEQRTNPIPDRAA